MTTPEETTPGLPAPATLIGSVAPAIAFLVVNPLLGLRWAIVAATVATIALSVARRRSGQPLGRFWPIVNLLVVARGLIGVVSDSDAVYFGLGIGTKFATGAGLIISVLIRRPIVALLMPNILRFRRRVVDDPVFVSTMAHLTLMWAVFLVASAFWDIWLFQNSSTNGYVAIRLVANWVAGIVVFGGAFSYADKRLSRIDGFEGLLPLFEEMTSSLTLGTRPPETDHTD